MNSIEANKTYFFRVGNAQYIYGKDETKDTPYWHMKYKGEWAIDTGRNITERTFPGMVILNAVDPKHAYFEKVKDEYTRFSSEEALFESLDRIAVDNLDHIMWGLTPKKWIKGAEMTQPVGFAAAYKEKEPPDK